MGETLKSFEDVFFGVNNEEHFRCPICDHLYTMGHRKEDPFGTGVCSTCLTANIKILKKIKEAKKNKIFSGDKFLKLSKKMSRPNSYVYWLRNVHNW